MSRLRVVFAGTPAFAIPALDAVAGSGHELLAVLTQPDRPAGRGRKLAPSAVKQRAQELGLAVHQPVSLRGGEIGILLTGMAPDVMVVVAYGLLIPDNILTVPRLGCVNVHASLLPRWRGAAPIQRAILTGDQATGVTLMQMDSGLDTGAVLLQRDTPIYPRDTAASLGARLAQLGAELLRNYLERITAAEVTPIPQDEAGVTYANKVTKDEAVIDWRRTADELDRQVRAFNPWPVAETLFQGQRLRIWEAEVLPDGAVAEPGRVIAADARGIVVATSQGSLRLLQVQLPGKRALSASDFVNAYAIEGQILG